MKTKKILRKTNKSQKKVKDEPRDTAPCMCRVHIELDKGRKDAIKCIGHGIGCPCTTQIDADITSTEQVEQLAKEEIKNHDPLQL